MKTGQLVGLGEAAQILGVSARTVQRLIDRRAIPSYKIGRQIRLNLDEVLAATKVDAEAHRAAS